MGQAKWDWVSEQPRPLRDLQLLDEASRGPLGSFEVLFHRTVLSITTLGSVATILNLALGPFVQQLIDMQIAPVPVASDQVWTPTMSFPSRYLNASSSDVVDAYNSGIWNDASIYSRRAHCPTGNCTWPAFESLNWCVKTRTYITSDLNHVKIDCPVAYSEDNFHSIYQEFGNYGDRKTNSTPCKIYIEDSAAPLEYPIVFSLEGGRGPLVLNPAGEDPSFKTTFPIELIAPMRASNGTPDGSTYLGVPDPLLALGYARLSSQEAKNSTVVIEALEQAVMSLCTIQYNLTVDHGVLKESTSSPDFGRFFNDTTAAGILGSNDTWCWTPNSTLAPIFSGPAQQTSDGVPYIFDTKTRAFCVGSRSSLPSDVANRVSSVYAMSLLKGSSNATVSYSDGDWNSNEDVTKRLKSRGLADVVGVIAASLNHLYDADASDSSERATGTAVTYETFVHVRWPWFILLVIVETMGLVYFLAVAYGRKRRRVLWKGSILAALYRGLQHHEFQDGRQGLDTASGMTAVAEQTSVMLKEASGERGADLCTVKRQ
ncbi:hypothetical protein Daus18300_007233 [Diaporthe australafricana]|uniref:Uncharacterized protein n=1 Tax=Diaporthe australafricana TaxID=127596 RepID=A0ABR3WP81_9PEZI